jgi:CheY-like chemotaxis protein
MAHTLLFADDSVTMQRVVELTFAQQGVDVISVSDGQQAIDVIRDKRPAMALVSVTLQKVNGFDVARFVRDQGDGRVPVLLLAGAFDNLNENQVREAGASGVLVKPFEPAVVIKRVKELLGISHETPPAAPARPPDTGSGRMFTTSDGPTRVAPSAVAPATGNETNVEPVGSGDYLAHLDAAFDSLDAQLAARSAPAARTVGGASSAATPDIEPAARPAVSLKKAESEPVPAAAPAQAAKSTQPDAGNKPVFEVDETWFNKPAAAAEGLGELTEFVVTRASDYQPPSSAPAKDDDRSWLPTPPREELPVVNMRAVPDAARPHVTPPTAPIFESTTATAPSAPSAPSAPDAFAMLWAQGQSEAAPTTAAAAVPAPSELSDHSVDAITAQLTERVAARVGAPLADRLINDLSARVTSGLAGPLAATVTDRLAVELPDPVAASVSDTISGRLVDGLADRLTTALGDRLITALADRLAADLGERVSAAVAERLSADLPERVGERVSERMLQSALGDGLRQTVHDVAERVVRAEVERIKAAADALRHR